MMNITAIVLTKNEEARIKECLKHLEWASERIVLDAGSTDDTQKLALQAGAQFFTREFLDFSSQRNHAMTLAKGEWILFIDADECVTPELRDEILEVIQDEPAVYGLPRHNYFFGQRLKFSGSVEDAPIRLFPRDSGKWNQPVHEYFESDLSLKKLRSPLIHHTTENLSQYKVKMDRYIPLEVETMKQNGRRPFVLDTFIRPIAKFILLYFFKFGIFDGFVGFEFACLSSYYDYKKYQLFWKTSRVNP